uniref:(R)-2-Hydroxypropyl-CoM dehydrogenase n=1 Tax=Alteromonadaceae bacterium PE-TB08W TaxID=1199097 RepID=A0A3G9E9B8_9ALTE|nr:(R)-2-Hydroxypropyl-CoM dehydrogenase [Alteromonadaceae bacterium PE-TB08W]
MTRVVLVTGAASGNGKAIASRFLRDGERVVAIDLSMESLDQTMEDSWEQFADSVLCVAANVSSEEDTQKYVDAALNKWGRIDVLVNNAGITGNQSAMELHITPAEEFDKVMAVNVRGIFLGCKAVLPHMLERNSGHIVNIASVAGIVAFPKRAAYSISKGAVTQLTKSVAADYAAAGIRCNAVCPGLIDTPLIRWRLEKPDLREELLARIPQKDVGSVDDVAGTVAFLAGPDASYFNGSCVVMDGAYTAI